MTLQGEWQGAIALVKGESDIHPQNVKKMILERTGPIGFGPSSIPWK